MGAWQLSLSEHGTDAEVPGSMYYESGAAKKGSRFLFVINGVDILAGPHCRISGSAGLLFLA